MAMQKQRGIKTGDPFEPKNAEDNMKKGGKVMEKESKAEMRKEEKADKKQDIAMIKKAFKEHDAQEHKGGKGTHLKLKKGGMLKSVDKEKNPGLAKLPTEVRNKMGFLKTGGDVKKMAKGGVTGKEMKAVGRNVARAMNQKSSSRGR